ncbi:reducing type I polyketide synthase [Xylariaceae sp. FL0255]|nr:reducing type I polyketide synthase [Xylariaceae sp. FL0255]
MAPWSSEGPEPIAVIGMGCRMPGDVRGPNDLWELLIAKGIANTPKVPKSRFDIDAYLHPSNERPGSFNVPGGYFIDDDPEAFDASMFGISPIEALWMDPQQRKLLEVVYEALENSGTTVQQIDGQRIGCFMGSFTYDFQHMSLKEPDFRHPYVSTGVDTGILGNRVSYVFNLKGPSLTVNTACSSSMYALDLACKAIISRECDGAIVGGSNLILTVDQQMNTARLGVLSPTNQCHTFDAAADGYSRAEGVGALYIKRLSAAIEAGDPIRAVIRSTATGCSGKSKDGMTHPSQDGQVEVITLAHQQANLTPENTMYVECHGTGTAVGDPIEVKAVHQALGVYRRESDPVLVGSIKPNIGHSEAASSMGTLIKAIMSLERGIFAPTAGISKLNPSIPWGDLNVRVVTEATPFPTSASFHRIGISAFGYGGTNSHCILQDTKSMVPGYNRHKSRQNVSHLSNGFLNGIVAKPKGKPHVLLFSAHDEPTLRNCLKDYASLARQDIDILDLAYTLGVRRTTHRQRTFAITSGNETDKMIEQAAADICEAPAEPAQTAFVFTGQGAQWPGMGATLMTHYPSVLQTIRKLDTHLSTLSRPPRWKIEKLLSQPDDLSLGGEAEFSQPLCVAVQIALVDLLARWGITPKATIGHSSGEIGAAYAAGLLSAETAITTGYLRGIVAADLDLKGAMLAVGLGAAECEDMIKREGLTDRVTVGCCNSPQSTTLSGEEAGILQIKKVLEKDGVFARVIQTSGKAYHSHLMKSAAITYAAYLQEEDDIAPSFRTRVPMFSTVLAEELGAQENGIPSSYWVSNLRKPVLFNQGVQLMLRTLPEVNVLVEVGPHAALAAPLRQILQEAHRPSLTYTSTLKRKENDVTQMLRLAGTLWARDAPIDVHAVTGIEQTSSDGHIRVHTGTLLVDLPSYHWTYSKPCWTESRFSKEHRTTGQPRHDILGRKILGTSILQPTWRNVLRQKDLPWLSQHRVGGEVLLPAAGYLALAMEAMTQLNAQLEDPLVVESYTMRNVVISTATVIPDDDTGTETLFSLHAVDGKSERLTDHNISPWYQFIASNLSYGSWKETARGQICLNLRGHSSKHQPAEFPLTPRRASHIDWLNKLRTLGFDLGPMFHHIGTIQTDGETHIAHGDIRIRNTCGAMDTESRYVLHPTVLDACLQPFLVAIHRGEIDEMRCATIPTEFSEVTIFSPSPEHLKSQGVLQVSTPKLGNRSFLSNTQLIGHDGSLLADFTGCRSLFYPAALPQELQGSPQRDLFVKTEWDIDADYLTWGNNSDTLNRRSWIRVLGILVHKDAKARVACFEEDLSNEILGLYPSLRLNSFKTVSDEAENVDFAGSGGLHALTHLETSSQTPKLKSKYDIVITRASSQSEPDLLRRSREMISDTGSLILVHEDDFLGTGADTFISDTLFTAKHTLRDGFLFLTSSNNPAPPQDLQDPAEKVVHFVCRGDQTALEQLASNHFKERGWQVSNICIDRFDPEKILNGQVVLFTDAEESMLINLEEAELKGLMSLTERARAITWVTSGGLLTGDRPEFGMTEGAARVIRNEKGSLDLVTLDFDHKTTALDRVIDLLFDISLRQHIHGRNGETEYYMKSGVPYVGRLASHRELHRMFVPDSGETSAMHQRNDPAVRVCLEKGALVFQRDDERLAEPIDADGIEIHAEAMGVLDSDTISKVDFLNCEISGTVTRVGECVKDIELNSRVFGFAFGSMSTFQRTASNLVRPVPDACSLSDAAALPLAFLTALYGLEDLARVEPGERVVILEGTGPAGIAAIQICLINKAVPIIVTNSSSTMKYLVGDPMFDSCQIIGEHGLGSVAPSILQASDGKGIDIILSSTTSNEAYLAECMSCMAELGRAVSIRSGNQIDQLRANVRGNTTSLTFMQFEPNLLVRRRPQIAAKLLRRCADLISAELIKPVHSSAFDIRNHGDQVFRMTQDDLGSGKFLLRYSPETTFQVDPSPARLKLRNDAFYILVGGLGGLGRQIALRMAKRGAKHIAFLSRSGAGSTAAKKTIDDLQEQGVECMVLSVDITNKSEVFQAINDIHARIPIRGVLNAAGVLRDCLFSNMTIDAWRDVTMTKVMGSLNLHEGLRGLELDFFVMTGSVTSTLGSTGQSNYGSANSFLGTLARHRRCRGLPGLSIDLPAILGVGLLENKMYQQSVKSKGMYGINTDEMLEAFEIALLPQSKLPPNMDHFVVGIQPRRFGDSIRSVDAHMSFDTDPRLTWLGMAIEEQTGDRGPDSSGELRSHDSIREQIYQAPSREKALDAVVAHISQRLARLLLIDEGSVHTTQKSVASYGLDSMIGAEFRNWIFRQFGVDMPFQKLLAGTMTIAELALVLCETVWANE